MTQRTNINRRYGLVNEGDIVRDITELFNSSPKMYLARFAQSGTSNPVVTEFLNTTGQTFSWTREDVGFFYCPLPTAPFISNYTIDATSFIKNTIVDIDGVILGYYLIWYGFGGINIQFRNASNANVEFHTLFSNKTLDFPAIYVA
jgi:hypothetical protein